MDGPVGQQILGKAREEGEQVGLKVLAIGAPDFRLPMNNKLPINSIEDFKGLKIRTMQVPIHMKAYENIGASPVPLPFGELYTALQTGVVDGNENGPLTLLGKKFYEVQKYLILSNHQPFTLLAYANKNWFESLPTNLQNILYEEFNGIVDEIVQGTLADDKKSLEHIEASGTKIIELTSAERMAFQDTLKPVRNKYIEIVGKEGENLLNILDAETAKYSK